MIKSGRVKSVVIVGGGASGWITANHLGRALSGSDIEITLIESPDIPTIGVGEGTVPYMRQALQSFGISETDFIRRCEVTFKQSIKFVNWMDKTTHGADNFYHHFFESPFPKGQDITSGWLAAQGNNSFAEFVTGQESVCSEALSPKTMSHPEFQGAVNYAYHLNAGKFSELLSENAISRFGVKHVRANVLDAILDEHGFIRQLKTDVKGLLDYDFYIDCSGFSSFLLGEKMSVPFIGKHEELLIDSALVAQVPTSLDQKIPPYTVATAHQAGWIWDIALPYRRGTGFVYSSAHMSDDVAQLKFERYLGCKNQSFRKIPMKVGYREKFWEKNCVAIGLSQGFVEPLEATALIVTEFSARFLAERFPVDLGQCGVLSKRFNETLRYSWDRIIDFIKLHYFLSDRTDSQFWLDNKNPDSLSDKLKEQLEVWRYYHPSVNDFIAKVGVFDAANYLYVLYGMNFETQAAHMSEQESDKIKTISSMVARRREGLLRELPDHRQLLERINQYGLQKV